MVNCRVQGLLNSVHRDLNISHHCTSWFTFIEAHNTFLQIGTYLITLSNALNKYLLFKNIYRTVKLLWNYYLSVTIRYHKLVLMNLKFKDYSFLVQ